MKALSEDQIGLITTKVLEVHEKQKNESDEKEKDKRLRNTKLLLQNYKAFKVYANRIEKNAVEDWEGIDVEELLVYGEDLVKSIRQSSQRTIVMVQHIDQALATLEYLYSLEKQQGTRRQYDILHSRYVLGKKIDEIAEEFEVDSRSVFRALKAVEERLSIILFGVYGIKIE